MEGAEIQVLQERSEHWASMFEPPQEYRDTLEWSLNRIEENQTNGTKPSQTAKFYSFIVKETNKPWLLRYGYINIRGSVGKLAANGTWTYFAQNTAALVNLGQFALFERATLYFNKQKVEENMNPRLVALVNALTRFSKSYSDTTATNYFYYRDTGAGGTDLKKQYILGSTYRVTALSGGITGGIPADHHVVTMGTSANAVPTYPVNLTTNALYANTSMYATDNPNYNDGFAKRAALCTRANGGKRVVELNLPLAWLFGFIDAMRFPSIGSEVKIELLRNTNSAEYLHLVTNDDTAQFEYDEIVLWLPYVNPSREVQSEIVQRIQANVPTSLKFYKYNYYYETAQGASVGVGSKKVWKTVITQKEPMTRLYFGTFLDSRVYSRTVNTQQFDHNNIINIKITLGNTTLPYVPIETSFDPENPKYSREYYTLINGVDKLLDEGVGVQFTSTEFANLYPLFMVDLRNEDLAIRGGKDSLVVTVEYQRSANAADVYTHFILTESEKEYKFESSVVDDIVRMTPIVPDV